MQNFSIFRQKLRKIGELFKFIKIDFSFLIIFVFALIIEEVRLYFYFIIFLILHELSHFIVAKKLGYMAGRIRLSFFGAALEGLDDFNLSDEIKIILAGPLFNLGVIVLCYLSFWFKPETYEFLCDIQLANFGLLMFNLLPIYPLDAGRIILALFSKKYKRTEALKKTKTLSFIFIILMLLLFVISCFYDFNFMLGLVAVNLAFMMFSRAKDTAYKRELFIKRKYSLIKKGLIQRTIYVNENTEIYKLFKFIDDYHFITFLFVNDNMEITKKLTELELFNNNYKIGS